MSGHFNQLTPAQAERLALLSEELGEAQQAIGKILRHGYESFDPTWSGDQRTNPTNRMNLTREVGDVTAAMAMLGDAGDISPVAVCEYAIEKAKKVGRYLHHAAPPTTGKAGA